MKNLKNTKGITLIALIVTIIVLIILAGISVNVLLGETGLITRAKDAKVKYQETELEEQIRLSYLSYKMLEQTGKNADLKTILQNIDGVTIEDMSSDTFCVKKDGAEVTVNTSGDIEKGKIEVWQGPNDIKCPRIENGTWYIDSPSQLNFLAYYVNNGCQVTGDAKDLSGFVPNGVTVAMTSATTIELTNDLDMGARPIEAPTEELKWETNANNALNWTPIGIVTWNDITDKVYGIFEGNNHTIKGLYVNRNETNNGIFGNSYTIQNLKIKSSYIKGSSCTGGIVGVLRSGKIENCYNIDTTIVARTGSTYCAGGIVGQALGSINKCTNKGNIIILGGYSGWSYSGGITGLVASVAGTDSIIENCQNYGNIINENKYKSIGGIVGSCNTGSATGYIIIENCQNYANISGGEIVGGIVGNSRNYSKIIDCTNLGNISGTNNIGGISGGLGLIGLRCRNFGIITGNKDVGGISGGAYSGVGQDISFCYNLGEVKGILDVGGISGFLGDNNKNAKIDKCYNKGNVTYIGEETAPASIGGIVGHMVSDANVTNSYYWSGIGLGESKGVGEIESGGTLAMQNQNVTQTSEDKNTYEDFYTWITNQ